MLLSFTQIESTFLANVGVLNGIQNCNNISKIVKIFRKDNNYDWSNWF